MEKVKIIQRRQHEENYMQKQSQNPKQWNKAISVNWL